MQMDTEYTDMLNTMILEFEDTREEIAKVVKDVETNMRASAELLVRQDKELKAFGHREYVQQMIMIAVSTVAYVMGVWVGGYGCSK